MKTLVFSFPQFDHYEKVFLQLGCVHGDFLASRFANKELHVAVQSPVTGETCIVIGSISPPESNFFTFLQLCHTLKKEKAARLIAFLPYLAYSRQDKNEPHESLGTALVGELLKASGVDTVVTVDVHSESAEKLFPLPLISLPTAALFAEEIERLGLIDASIVAPDQGAIQRCQEVSAALNKGEHIAWAEKTRKGREVSHEQLHGTVKERVVIIDDILDTGATLLSCCNILQQHNVKEITVMVSHGLFTGKKWRHLFKYGLTSIVCLDTVPTAAAYGRTLSLAPLLRKMAQTIL